MLLVNLLKSKVMRIAHHQQSQMSMILSITSRMQVYRQFLLQILDHEHYTVFLCVRYLFIYFIIIIYLFIYLFIDLLIFVCIVLNLFTFLMVLFFQGYSKFRVYLNFHGCLFKYEPVEYEITQTKMIIEKSLH